MGYIKKNLTVILLSVMCTLLLVITIFLIVNHNTFKFSNSSSRENTNNKNTKEVEDNKKEVIKKEEKEEIIEEKKEDLKEENKVVEEKEVEAIVPKEEVKEEKTEAKLLSFFENESSMFDTKDTSITDKLKASFTSIIDFIFYEKEIKGYTFKELTNSAKLKVISIALAIDNKIDTYFPDYKDKIKDKYTSVKATLASKYLEVVANFCSKDPETCSQAREDFENMKKAFGLTGAKVSEAAKKAGSKVKELYEGWR